VTRASIFQVGHLERVPLGTPYPGIVAHVGRLLGKFPAPTEVVIDVTGVGKPVFEMFTYSGISPLGVLITAGTAETRDGVICGVPKLTLVSRLQALLHQGRLKIHRELAEAETLVRELQDFRVEYTAAGHLTFNLAPANTTILFWRSPLQCGARMAAACRPGGISKRCASWGWARRRVSRAITSALIWGNPATRQRSR